jgi:hypothetical protein
VKPPKKKLKAGDGKGRASNKEFSGLNRSKAASIFSAPKAGSSKDASVKAGPSKEAAATDDAEPAREDAKAVTSSEDESELDSDEEEELAAEMCGDSACSIS